MDGALFCVVAILIILAYVQIATLRTRVTRAETTLDARAVDCGMQWVDLLLSNYHKIIKCFS